MKTLNCFQFHFLIQWDLRFLTDTREKHQGTNRTKVDQRRTLTESIEDLSFLLCLETFYIFKGFGQKHCSRLQKVHFRLASEGLLKFPFVPYYKDLGVTLVLVRIKSISKRFTIDGWLPVIFLYLLQAFSTWCFRSFSAANRFGQAGHAKGFNCEYLILCTALWWLSLPFSVENRFEQNEHLKDSKSESISSSQLCNDTSREKASERSWLAGSFYLHFTRP